MGQRSTFCPGSLVIGVWPRQTLEKFETISIVVFIEKKFSLPMSLKKKLCQTTNPKFHGPTGRSPPRWGPVRPRSGEKCFLNPIGFSKFFECFPNQYAKHFVGWRKPSDHPFTRNLTLFLKDLNLQSKFLQLFSLLVCSSTKIHSFAAALHFVKKKLKNFHWNRQKQ